jgi:hypothetical protein
VSVLLTSSVCSYKIPLIYGYLSTIFSCIDKSQFDQVTYEMLLTWPAGATESRSSRGVRPSTASSNQSVACARPAASRAAAPPPAVYCRITSSAQ